MNAQDFAYWLQGFSELNEGPPSPEQWESIKAHLALVFTKVTPAIGDPNLLKLWNPGPAKCNTLPPGITQTFC